MNKERSVDLLSSNNKEIDPDLMGVLKKKVSVDLRAIKPQNINFKKAAVFIVLFCAIFALVVLFISFWNQSNSSSVFNIVFPRERLLRSTNDRVNVLLLGIPGGKHEGPNLTDTIIVASYDFKSGNIDLISLPRDLWIDEYKVKINALYQVGLNKGEGLSLVKKKAAEILGLEIHYVIRLDFNGFIKAVDQVGGLEIEIARAFDDYLYPIEGKQNDTCEYKEELIEIDEGRAQQLGVKSGKLKVLLDFQGKIATAAAEPNKDIIYSDEGVKTFFHCRFEHVSFKQGLEQMDGERALKFVRSRHGTNNEGSDFARSKRQQLILQAFKAKVLSLSTLLDPQKITGLLSTFGSSIETDIEPKEYLEFIKLVKENRGIKSFVIDGTNSDPLLVSPNPADYGGAWVLVPKVKDYSKIHQFVSSAFNSLEATESGKIRVREAKLEP